MGGSVAGVPRESLTQAHTDAWSREIRDYLLGRLSVAAVVVPLRAVQRTNLDHPPIRRWWTFEGKQYTILGGPLAAHWATVIRAARRLDETFNPRLRVSDRADGAVDWGHTLARGPHTLRPEYVVRSSGIGLSDEERTALRGWVGWIRNEWAAYATSVQIEHHLDWGSLATDVEPPFTFERLRSWAHTARRSRWPLLHNVVAESIRPVIEPEELDRVPLPSERAKLFELVCLVRIARGLAPPPRELRWLNLATTSNRLRLQGTTCHYQQGLDRNRVLATRDYAGPLANAVDAFGLRVPEYVDLAFDFDTPRFGFDGLIVEAKSGSQQYDATVAQLRTYRDARSRRSGSRYVIWGIIERPGSTEAIEDQLARVVSEADDEEDLWLFSGADDIGAVLRAVFGDAQPLP
jgi:hypothetical protein